MPNITVINFPDEAGFFDIDAQGDVRDSDGAEDEFTNGGDVGVWVKNASGGQIDMTFPAQKACSHGFTHNSQAAIPDGFEGFVALRLESDRFNDSNSKTKIQYSAAGLRVAAVRLPA